MPDQHRVARFLSELRRRKVVQVTMAYALVGWGVIEFANVIEDALSLPPWTDSLVIALVALGLPIAIVFAWVFDLGPGGVTATPPVDQAASEGAEISEGKVLGHFAILERLGEGGMGVVHRARDTTLDRLVALKFLPWTLNADQHATRRFLQEARSAARLDHPNICTIHEITTLEDGRSFITMPLYEGRTLGALLSERGRIAAEEAAGLGAQVARGLSAAHEAGIVHRDIKPANLLLTDDGVLKILDFGIAKMAGVELTREGAALGTVAYMSPEQVNRRPVDGRADLWALGVVLYELCAGERPFIGRDTAGVLNGILELDPLPLSERRPEIPIELSALVERCLSKTAEERPESAEEVADLLAAIEERGRPDSVEPIAAEESDPTIATRVPEAGDAKERGDATETGDAAKTDVAVTRGAGDAHPAESTPDAPTPPATALAAEGERRQATLLIAELAGRSVLEESLSPEESDELLDTCREVMNEIVSGLGGVVNRNTGETLQALFGIPTAQEDDAVRAVRAARELCDRVKAALSASSSREGLGLRCGVDTGRAVVRADDSGEGQYRVLGGPAERSARLAAQARAGEVLVGDACFRAIAPFFQTEEAGELPGRGDDAATPTFRVLGETGIRSRLEAVAETEGLTELTGREAELGLLAQACEAARGGDGRFVSIVGDVGVGKSRILHEFSRRIDETHFDVIRGRCQATGGEVPYLPFIDLLRDRLGLARIGGQESPEEVSERVRAISTDLDDFMPFYHHLLSVGKEDGGLQEALAGDQLRVGLVESLSALLTLSSQQKPTIVLLEDWHWVDAASKQTLRQLLEMVSAYPLLIVVTSRPEAGLDWGAPAGHTPINLGPVSAEDSAVIVRSVLNADEAPDAFTRFLHDRTGGNPFFLEEVCQALREDGTLRVEDRKVIVDGALDHLELPDTVQGVLRTRLDRLDGPTRRLVRYASVVGQEFAGDVLQRALGEDTDLAEGLGRLRELGLIQQIRVVPTPMYRFKHALTQDVAYDGLLERQRAQIHGAVGDSLEALPPDRLDAQLDRLAEHFAQAGRWQKAVDYAISATDRVWAFSEFQEATEVQARALEWASHLEAGEAQFETRIKLLLRQERLFEYLGRRDAQQDIIDDLFEMLDPDRHALHLATTYIRRGDLCILTREHADAEAALKAAIRLSEEASNPDLERHALRSMGLLRWHQERHEEAIAHVERALELDRLVDNREAVIGNVTNLGQLYRALGEHERALEYLMQALELEHAIERTGSEIVEKESYILHTIGTTYSSMGDSEKALEYLEAARAITETKPSMFNPGMLHVHLIAIARQHLEAGRLDEALALYEESVAVCRKTGHLEGRATSLRLLGDVLLNLERHAEALPHLEEAAGLYAEMHDHPAEVLMRRGIGVAQEALGHTEAARTAWADTGRLAEGLGQRDLELEAVEGAARLLRSEDPAASLEAYQKALELSTETGDVARCGGFRYAIGLLHWGFGAYEEALRSFETAYEELLEAGERVDAGLALNSIGRTLRDLGRLDEARERLDQSIALNRDTGEKLLESHSLATLGDVHLDSGEPELAADRFTAALEIRRGLEDLTGQGWMLHRLARAQRALDSSDGIAYYLDEAEEIASRCGALDLTRACEELRLADDTHRRRS